MSRSCGERANAGTRRRNGAGSLFGENGKSEKRSDYMNSNPYKNLPPLERRLGGVIPEERVGGRVRAHLPILSHLRCGPPAPLRAAKGGESILSYNFSLYILFLHSNRKSTNDFRQCSLIHSKLSIMISTSKYY